MASSSTNTNQDFHLWSTTPDINLWPALAARDREANRIGMDSQLARTAALVWGSGSLFFALALSCCCYECRVQVRNAIAAARPQGMVSFSKWSPFPMHDLLRDRSARYDFHNHRSALQPHRVGRARRAVPASGLIQNKKKIS